MAWTESPEVLDILQQASVQSQIVRELYGRGRGAGAGTDVVVTAADGKRYRIVDVERHVSTVKR
jgi:hypothetical protein